LEDYIIGYTAINFFKGRSLEKMDIIAFEAIYPLCMKDKLLQLQILWKMSVQVNKPIKFRLYESILLKKCTELELYDVMEFLSREDVNKISHGLVADLINTSHKSKKKINILRSQV